MLTGTGIIVWLVFTGLCLAAFWLGTIYGEYRYGNVSPGSDVATDESTERSTHG